ncbi:abc transporter f family member 4 [Quercus suber]|uniref:Abc transporter f family member 4 n=1 Tax=Quercus suber TaxID=58331 RepID=A0AAW0KT30_QUESU
MRLEIFPNKPSIWTVLSECLPLLLLLCVRACRIAAIEKKKPEDTGATSKTMVRGKDVSKEGKKEKLSVLETIASIDQKPDKPEKGSSTSSIASSRKSKTKVAPKVSSYTYDIDLPQSEDDDDDNYASEEGLPDVQKQCNRQRRSEFKLLEISTIRGKELLKNTSVKISHGKRYGFVGPNGMGKSTLLKLLAWGKIPVPKNIDLLLVEQEVVGDDRTALEAVVSANEELARLQKEVAFLQNSFSAAQGENEDDDCNGDDVGEKLAELYEKLQNLESDAGEAQASKILAGLGFNKEMQGRPTRSFSGGWRMRISLAMALFAQPTLLLLDEPTNHIDLRAVLWLEQYLCRWKKTLVVVSHDRDLLNTVCNEIIHLHDLKLHFYRGNFDDFETGYEHRLKEMNKKYEDYVRKDKDQQQKVKDQAKHNAAKEEVKNKKKGKVDEDEPLPEAPKKWKDYSVEFHFPEPTELTPPLLQLIEVSFSYPNREDFRLSNVDVGIDMGTRVAIVGPNGAGKTTLLNLLAGDLVATNGEVRRSQKLRIGRYSQHFVDLLTMEETPVQYLRRLHPDQKGLSKQEAVRATLGKFGLPGHNHHTPIAKLSGGQKARVVFSSISMSKPHILLLDEPTNHLDMQSIDALADALDEFTGGVILVSHDSRLISRVCEDEEKSEIWVVENGTISTFPGTLRSTRRSYKDRSKQRLTLDLLAIAWDILKFCAHNAVVLEHLALT